MIVEAETLDLPDLQLRPRLEEPAVPATDELLLDEHIGVMARHGIESCDCKELCHQRRAQFVLFLIFH